MRAGDGTRTHDVQLGKLAFYGMGNSIGVVEVWRGSARRARRLRAVHAGSVARPSAACLCRGPAGRPRSGRRSGPSGRGERCGARVRSSPRATCHGRAGRGRAVRLGPSARRPCGGARAEVRQNLVDHRALRDARHHPHRASAVRTRERVDFENCRSSAAHRRVASVDARRGATTIGTGGWAPAASA